MVARGGQIYPCSACQGSGAVKRAEVGPQDYVFELVVPAGATSTQETITILSYDFLLKWLVAFTATPTDTLQVKDNTGYVWSNVPLQVQNFAGTGPLPFPQQPNLLLVKNSTITITYNGAAGHSCELVFRGIALWDTPAPAPTAS
jgi:hypothetical protein